MEEEELMTSLTKKIKLISGGNNKRDFGAQKLEVSEKKKTAARKLGVRKKHPEPSPAAKSYFVGRFHSKS